MVDGRRVGNVARSKLDEFSCEGRVQMKEKQEKGNKKGRKKRKEEKKKVSPKRK